MNPFSAITIGPFIAKYHQDAAGQVFRDQLFAYLEKEVLPQLEEPFDRVAGTLTAQNDADHFCGPNSAVRDIYKIELAFMRAAGADILGESLLYNPTSQVWRPLHRRTPRLKTRRMIAHEKSVGEEVERMVAKIIRKESIALECPHCSNALNLTDSPDLFNLQCPRMCFKYNFHRDPTTGDGSHGHFFVHLQALTPS